MPAFLPSSPIIPHGHPVYKMVAALIQGGSSLVSLLWKNPPKQPDTCFTNLISISFFSLCMCTYVCPCPSVHMHVEAREQHQDHSLDTTHLVSLKQNLSLKWNLPSRLFWLEASPRDSPAPPFSAPRLLTYTAMTNIVFRF